jgi:pimeloyl-ACP methyl ester carboxylesterase
MAILAAQQWKQMSALGKVCTWASICDIERRFPKGQDLKKWEKSGVRHVKNSRTLQDLPQSFELYANFERNRHRLDIKAAAKDIAKHLHIFHGDQDTTVPISEAHELNEVSGAKLSEIKGADHVFGASHPWNKPTLPPLLEELCKNTLKCL